MLFDNRQSGRGATTEKVNKIWEIALSNITTRVDGFSLLPRPESKVEKKTPQ